MLPEVSLFGESLGAFLAFERLQLEVDGIRVVPQGYLARDTFATELALKGLHFLMHCPHVLFLGILLGELFVANFALELLVFGGFSI